MRHRVKPALADMKDIQRVRAAFATPLPAPRGVRFRDDTLAGVPGEWVQATATSDKAPAGAGDTLLYLHGGGFVGCSARTHRPLTAAFARLGLRVFVPDYRLAPEHPFPAAPQDALAVFRALRTLQQQQPQAERGRLVVAGDSAGGNLALGLMLALKDAGEALPDAAALFSPSTDMVGDSASLELNTPRDAMFHGAQLDHLANAYLQGADRAQPLASPLRGDLGGLPPLLIHVGSDEVLRDDSLRLATKAREAGVTVELCVYAAVPHVWQLLRFVPEARQSVAAAARFLLQAVPRAGTEELDVLIIGAGLSGIGAAVHLQQQVPGKNFALLESRQAIGGTWDLFRYPGVRSDSDMYTLGYRFKPWGDAQAIAGGAAIRGYVADTAAEHGVAPLVRYGHRVVAADWSPREACWTVTVEREGRAEPTMMRARFIAFCGGYYSYSQGYRPRFADEERFGGRIVHPQFWPEDLDVSGKQVVVIGSGATAVTLVPELAKTAAKVTMLQRSPSYLFARPTVDDMAEKLKRWLPLAWAYHLVRLKNVAMQMYFFRLARKYPEAAKQRLVGLVRHQLPTGFDVQRHFSPTYNPWDQRLCLIPDADLLQSIGSGKAAVVTDTIERFTEQGVRLQTGQELAADIVVTATGLELEVLGGIRLSKEGRPIDLAQAFTYKGLMYSGVPNLVITFGYTNASWTLKSDLTAQYTCRLLRYMDRRGHRICTPVTQGSMPAQAMLDFTSGYVRRAVERLPKQGARKPWRLNQNYVVDLLALRFGRIDDGVLSFDSRQA